MTREIVVRSVRNAPKFTPAEGEEELKVRGRLRIEGELFRIVVARAQSVIAHAEDLKPLNALLLPVREPLEVRVRLAEEFEFHLLELACAEGEVARCNLVSEGLTDLADAEGNLLPGSALHVLKVHKDTLCRLRAQVDRVLCVLGHTLEGLEHEVELADVREVVLAAARARNLVLLDIGLHLLVAPAVHAGLELYAVLRRVVLNQLVRAEALVTALAVHERIREAADVTGGNPGLGVHENRAIHADIVGRLLNKLLPPGSLHVVLKLHAEIAVVPGICESAVDFRTRIDKSSRLCECHDFFHCISHRFPLSLLPMSSILLHPPHFFQHGKRTEAVRRNL